MSSSNASTIDTSGSKGKCIAVFSGGSAANSIIEVFSNVAQKHHLSLKFIMPISDNGGSSSELIRVFGGPGVGDIRNRLIRFIPCSESEDDENSALRKFFSYRLPAVSTNAKREWQEILETRSTLWQGIGSAKRELIRSYLNFINGEIVKRIRPTSEFNFSSACIGNLFLTGARLFTRDLESAIYLLGCICKIPEYVSVLPAINTNFTHHIAAQLANGNLLLGQNAISHPCDTSPPTVIGASSPDIDKPISLEDDNVEDENLPGSLATLRKPNIEYSKSSEDLPSRILRIWYINPYGQEIRLNANPKVTESLRSATSVIYSIGSLFTSIIPSIILKEVGKILATGDIRSKILILNNMTDRETGPVPEALTAFDFVAAIAKAAGESRGIVNVPKEEYKHYVTHVIHLEGQGTPKTRQNELKELGIEAIQLYGRRAAGSTVPRYDETVLAQTLDSIIGRKLTHRSRRNTLQEGHWHSRFE